jgi:AcrR family transcriptional regulator
MPNRDVPVLRWVRPPQQARSQETLHRILDAAEVLVAEKSFEDASVSEIVRRANSSVGAFYARFEDKDALLRALSERFVDQAMATADAALDPARWERATISQILRSVVRFLVSVYRERAGLIRAFVIRNHTDLDFRARQSRLSLHVKSRVCDLLLDRVGEIRHPDPERAVRFGITLVIGALEHMVLFGELRSSSLALSDDEFAEELARAYLSYLGVEETLSLRWRA